MKTHTNSFKENIVKFGREIDSIITYELNNEEIELGSEQLNSVSPHYEGAILKSVMKQLDIDSNIEIPLGTILTYEFGLKNNRVNLWDNEIIGGTDDGETPVVPAVFNRTKYYISIEPNKTYILSSENDEIDFSHHTMIFYEFDTNKNLIDAKEINEDGTFTTDSNVYYVSIAGDRNDFYKFATNIWLEEGDKIPDEYEYIDFGNYVVYSIEKQEDTNSYKIICYDKMLYAMKDYENSGITFPITIRNYISAICNKIGLTFANSNDTFVNYNKEIPNELYLSYNEETQKYTSLGYTFRDVLDELAEVTASTICINEDDELEIRYIKDVGELTNAIGSNLTLETNGSVKLENFEIEGKTTQDGEPTPDNPVELVSVGTYNNETGKYDIEVKATGKNLFNKDNYLSGYFEGNESTIIASSNRNAVFYIKTDKNTNYNLHLSSYNNLSQIRVGSTDTLPNSGVIVYNVKVFNYTNKNLIYNTGNYNYIVIRIQANAGYTITPNNINDIITEFQVEKGNVFTDYEEYISNTYLYTLDQPLRSNIDGTIKDLLYINNGILYVDRYIRHLNLAIADMNNGEDYPGWTNLTQLKNDYPGLNSSFTNANISYQSNIGNQGGKYSLNTRSTGTLFLSRNQWNDMTQTDWQTNYPNLVLDFNYALSEPYTEELGTIQIPSTYEGITYLNTTDELEPNMNITYVSEIETIDEENLKDVNVNFGEKFGAVNTIILSRSADSDKIAQSIPSNLADSDKIAIQITDNQIMNDNNRADFIPAILNQLYGLEYYINDFSSTGICYLDLCDKYKVKIGDNSYSCVMFNDEINVTQGLEEFIYTDMQEENQTDYSYTSNDDRKVNQVYIIAKKNQGEIEAVVGRVKDIEIKEGNDYTNILNKFKPIDEKLIDIDDYKTITRQLQTDTYTKTEIQQIANGTGVGGVKVSAVITTSGTFDEDGMTYEKTNAPTKTTINQIGLNTKDKNDNSLLFAGYVDENTAPQDLLNKYGDYANQTIVGTDNIIVNNYLNIGTHSRIQDYGNGTGIFWR